MSADSIVTFSRLVDPSFSPQRLRIGTPVLVSISRRCDYGRPCGDFFVMTEDGTLLSDYRSDDQMDELSRNPLRLRFSDLDTTLISGREIRGAIEGCDAIAVTGLIAPGGSGEGRVPAMGGVFELVQARWAVHGSVATPRYVSFPMIEGCRPDMGWLYMLPVPRGFRSDTLSLDVCARVLAVKDGESLALGIPVDSLPRFVRRTERGLSLAGLRQ